MADEGDFEAQELARLAALEAAQRLRVERLTRSAALDAASPEALTVAPDAIAAATDFGRNRRIGFEIIKAEHRQTDRLDWRSRLLAKRRPIHAAGPHFLSPDPVGLKYKPLMKLGKHKTPVAFATGVSVLMVAGARNHRDRHSVTVAI